MGSKTIYFSNNFFSSGRTTIYDENKMEIGALDLKSTFTSGVEVLDQSGNRVIQGKTRAFSSKWFVSDASGTEIGWLKQKLSFFKKKYEYEASGRGLYKIVSESYSKSYVILDGSNREVAHFERTSNFFQSDAFKLTNHSDELSNEELIAVVMGISAVSKQNGTIASMSGAT